MHFDEYDLVVSSQDPISYWSTSEHCVTKFTCKVGEKCHESPRIDFSVQSCTIKCTNLWRKLAVLETMFAVLSHARLFLAMNLFHVTKTIIRPTKAGFTLSGCVYDPIYIRFGSASLQYESLCLHWADRYFCAHALGGLLRETIVFPSFRSLWTILLAIFFRPLTMQSELGKTFLACLRYFRRQFCFQGRLHFLRTLVYRSQTARKALCRCFLVMSSFSPGSLHHRAVFCWPFNKFAHPLQNYSGKSYTLSV